MITIPSESAFLPHICFQNAHTWPFNKTAVGDDTSGRCFLGQRAGKTGFSVFSLYLHDTEPEESTLRIEDLIADCGPGTHASARALYDLSEASDGDVLGGCIRERANSMSFARLAMEWTYSSDTARTVGSQPPSGCPSLLLVGGACPPSAANATLRDDVEILANTIARNVAGTARPARREGARGPFLGGGRNGGVVRSANDEDQAKAQLEADIEALLSGSENLAELAARAAFRHGMDTSESEGIGEEGVEGRGRDDDATGEPTETIAFEVRLDEGETVGQRFRGDLDFSELLWELAARSSSAEGVRSTLSRAFHAVGEGHIFPVIRRENQTAVGRHIREGVALTREARYYNPMSMGDTRSSSTKRNEFGGPGGQQGEADAITWREQGAALLEDVDNLAEIFVELGVYKVTLDLYHWFEKRAGVLAADIERVLPTAAADKASADLPSTKSGSTELKTLDPRLERLNILMMTRDLVTLAQSYETPWRQVRAVALSCLAKLSRRTRVGSSRGSPSTAQSSAYSPSSPPSTTVFPVALPKPIPAGARTKLAHPIFWELLLEPAESGSYGGAETISYTVTTAGLFQLKGADAASVFSAGAARAAQNALEKCPPLLVPEVLSCVAGAESFAELTRRQKVMRAKGDAAGDDKAATFVCKHQFMPW